MPLTLKLSSSVFNFPFPFPSPLFSPLLPAPCLSTYPPPLLFTISPSSLPKLSSSFPFLFPQLRLPVLLDVGNTFYNSPWRSFLLLRKGVVPFPFIPPPSLPFHFVSCVMPFPFSLILSQSFSLSLSSFLIFSQAMFWKP